MNTTEIIPGVALGEPINLSRRRFLASTAVGALVIGFGLPLGTSRVQAATGAAAERGTQVPRLPGDSPRRQRAFAQPLHGRRPRHPHRHGADRR